MKILFISSSPYRTIDKPYSAIFLHNYAKALNNAAQHVTIISPRLLTPRRATKNIRRVFRISEEMDGNIPVLRLSWVSPFPSLDLLHMHLWGKAGLLLAEKYREKFGLPDIIHAHNVHHAGILAMELNKKWGVPYIITEHSSEFFLDRISEKLTPFFQSAYKNASARTFVSPFLGNEVEKRLGSIIKPWIWIPNIIDPLFLEEEAQTLIPNTDNITLFHAGNLIEVKQQRKLIHAFFKAFANNSKVELRIGGNGPLLDSLQRLCADLGISDQVKFLGTLSRADMLREMKNCSFYVHSSRVETFGVVLIEALACGKPVVTTACGGPDSFITSKNGILVPVDDTEEFVYALKKMAQVCKSYNPEEIKQSCISLFGPSVVTTQLLDLYRKLLKPSD